jgi:transcriptional regulator with XRE-family HTH domain
MNQKFNAKKFSEDILAKRLSKNMVYSQSLKEIGVNASVLHRAESGNAVSIEAFALICNWLGKKIQNYF